MHRAAIYCRLSSNPDGTLDSVARQLKVCRKLAADRGHTITGVYTDDNLSAWKRSVRRPGWEAMFTAIEAGEHDGIISYHSDRLARNGRDGERLLEAGEKGLALETASGDYDLSTGDGRMVFRVLNAASIKSSDDTSRRIKLLHDANRSSGKLHGRPAYGFMDDPDDPNGPRIVDPAHAAVIREVAARVLDGHSWKDIVADLGARGVRTPDHGKVKGRPFTRTTLRSVMLSPRIAGDIVHRGKVVGRIRTSDGAVAEPILDRDTYGKVVAELSGRAHGRPASTRFLLSGIIRCECGGVMACSPTSSRRPDGTVDTYRVYKCRGDAGARCSTAVMSHHAEAEVRDRVLDFQREPKRLARLSKAGTAADAKIAKLREEKDRLVRMGERYEAKLDAGIWDQATYERHDDVNNARITAIVADIKAYASAETQTAMAVAALEADYDNADQDGKRRMIKAALASVTVTRGRRPDPRDRVLCQPR